VHGMMQNNPVNQHVHVIYRYITIFDHKVLSVVCLSVTLMYRGEKTESAEIMGATTGGRGFRTPPKKLDGSPEFSRNFLMNSV